MSEIPLPERRTALLVPVPAEALVDAFRRRHHDFAFERRIPPHVTVLFPFVPAASLDDVLRAQLAVHFSGVAPFEAALTGIGRFDGCVWLAPEPRDRFVDLITATYARFPKHPPYGGKFTEPEPHLTVAEVDEPDSEDAIAELARMELGRQLPFGFVVDCVSLIAEQANGMWQESMRFGLG